MSRVIPWFLSCFVCGWLLVSTTALADDKDVKPIAMATGNSRDGRLGSFEISRNGVAIRNAEELVALTGKAKAAKEHTVQKEFEAELAKLLKVESIDWKKQMVIATIAEKFDSLKTDGKILRAYFFPYKEPIALAIPPTPKVMALVERVEGEVKFVQLKLKDKE